MVRDGRGDYGRLGRRRFARRQWHSPGSGKG
jgi:hypothetical protein